MPKVFERDGFRFFFYSNDHSPIHIHVVFGGGEAVFLISDDVVLRESVGLAVKEIAKAQRLAEEHKNLIVEKWHEFFKK